jgi:hypothetical protein
MCISLGVLAIGSLVTSAASTVMGISGANANAAAQQEMLDLQRKQMRDQMEMQVLQAKEAALNRMEEYRRGRAANLAAMAASGVTNISFLQGIIPAEEAALRTDLANIRLGFLGNQNRMVEEIRVNRLNSAVTETNRKTAIAGSLINFAGSAMQIGNFYQTYKTPSAMPKGKVSVGGGDPGQIVVTRGK